MAKQKLCTGCEETVKYFRIYVYRMCGKMHVRKLFAPLSDRVASTFCIDDFFARHHSAPPIEYAKLIKLRYQKSKLLLCSKPATRATREIFTTFRILIGCIFSIVISLNSEWFSVLSCINGNFWPTTRQTECCVYKVSVHLCSVQCN